MVHHFSLFCPRHYRWTGQREKIRKGKGLSTAVPQLSGCQFPVNRPGDFSGVIAPLELHLKKLLVRTVAGERIRSCRKILESFI